MTHFENENKIDFNEDIHSEHKNEEVHRDAHKEHSEHKSHKESHPVKGKKLKFDMWKVATGVLALILVVTLISSFTSGPDTISKEEAGVNMVQFVNTNLLQGQAVAKLESVTEEGGLYNVKLTISGQEVDSYVTKDGEIFFPQGIKVNEYGNEAASSDAQQQAPADVPKSDKPVVELFVMSHCPYGTQAEKGILPVVNLLGDKIDFQLKFVYYAMHGKTEVDEQMRQVCINNEQTDKYNDYLACFLEAGEAKPCLTSAEINTDKLDLCVTKLDAQYKITENFNDKSTWLSGNYPLFNVHKADNEKYGVGGSPTLVINGEQANSARSPAAYLATICAAFNDQPKECTESTGVSTETYQPGFGYEVGAATAASCG